MLVVLNFKPSHLKALFDAKLSPQLNQIQLGPYRPRKDDVAFNRQHGIAVASWRPLDLHGGLTEEPAVVHAARELGKTPAQIVLRWHMQKGFVTVPKSGNPQRTCLIPLCGGQLKELDALANPRARIEDSDVIGV